MNISPYIELVNKFNQNWSNGCSKIAVTINDGKLKINESHGLYYELRSLCEGRACSLPFIMPDKVIWCSLAPESNSLDGIYRMINAWLIPSYGGNGFFTVPNKSHAGLKKIIIQHSPDGYYRWTCPGNNLDIVLKRLRTFRCLESAKPKRSRVSRPSRYELRSKFELTLTLGDRDSAHHAIELLDFHQLETAVNIQFMRIRFWHEFGEYDKIRNNPNLEHILSQPLPPRILENIEHALGKVIRKSSVSSKIDENEVSGPEIEEHISQQEETIETVDEVRSWRSWFASLKKGEREGATLFIDIHSEHSHADFSPTNVSHLVECIDDLTIDDSLLQRDRDIIIRGVNLLLQDFAREPQFPRANLSLFYLSLLQLWSELYEGNSTGQEHGHVLLELSNALLQVNQNCDVVLATVESWWKAKASPSQLHFALDAIELLDREFTDSTVTYNLWIEAAEVIKRHPERLTSADRESWRRIGRRLDFPEDTILEYLAKDETEEKSDLLVDSGVTHVAIVCMREAQAKEAEKEIVERTGAKVSLVTSKVAGGETTRACHADVILFVWMATSHSVFRAFDGYDRQSFCYVQGTGSSSIVRALERWVIKNH